MLGFLGYEFYLFRKEKTKNVKPTIPTFNENSKPGTLPVIVVPKNMSPVKKFNVFGIIAGILLSIFIGVAVVFGIFYKNVQTVNQDKGVQPDALVKQVESSGIKIYNKDWKELTQVELDALEPGISLYIGITSISGADIDRARIRVDEELWKTEHVTKNYNKQYNVYYREYEIGSGSGQLKIEAELHSSTDGWLGQQ